MDIKTESINRIRLSNNELKMLLNILNKTYKSELSDEEIKLHKILIGRINGRLKLKEENKDL